MTSAEVFGGRLHYDVRCRQHPPSVALASSLASGGTIVTVNPLFENGAVAWLAKAIGRVRLKEVLVQPSGADLETVGSWISAGRVRPVIDRSYPLPDAAAAHRCSESPRVRGKLVLIVDERLAEVSAESISPGKQEPSPPRASTFI